MFDVPIDAWYAAAGVGAASLVILGVATGLPTAPPPDATGAARTVDGVAASEYAALGEHPVEATAVRISRRGVTLRNGDGRAHATFRYGPVTPVRRGTSLGRLLFGVPPEQVFGSPAAFATAVREARARNPEWRSAPPRLRARHVTWEGIDVTLVG